MTTRFPIRPRPPGRLPPWMIFFLYLPASLAYGYCAMVPAYALTQAGVGMREIAELAALLILPHTLSILWSPLVDGTLGPRRWYLLSLAGILATLLSLLAVPLTAAGLPLLKLLAFGLGTATSFSGVTCSMVMAYDVDPAHKGRAAGWLQAANLGGNGLGGGVALMLAQHHGVALPAFVILALSVLFAASLGAVAPRPAAGAASPVARFLEIGREVWGLLRSRAGLLTALLMIVPIGSGAASNLFITFGRPFHVGAPALALVNGMGGGIAALAGTVIAGWVCDRMDRRAAYCVFGLLLGAVAAGMAAAPRDPATFLAFGLLYSLGTGCCYAAFGAAILDVAGRTAAATKMSLLTCLSNLPIMLMGLAEGRFGEAHGVDGVLLTDAAAGALPAAIFLLLIGVRRARPPRTPHLASPA